MKDIIIEMQYGEGAVRVIGKVLLMNTSPTKIKSEEVNRMIIGGCIIGDLLDLNRERDDVDLKRCQSIEMWEGKIIFIPTAKYRNNKVEPCFHGFKLNQMFRSAWSQAMYWKEKFFEKPLEGLS